jgi:hypothetical protein
MTITVKTKSGLEAKFETYTNCGRVCIKGYKIEKKGDSYYVFMNQKQGKEIFNVKLPSAGGYVEIQNQNEYEEEVKMQKEKYYAEIRKIANQKTIEKVVIEYHSYTKLSVRFGIENQEYRDDYNKISYKIKKYWNNIENIISENSEILRDYDDYNSWTTYTIPYKKLIEILENIDTKKIDKETEKTEIEKKQKIEMKKEIDDVLYTYTEFDNSFGENPEGEWMVTRTEKKDGKEKAISILTTKYKMSKEEAENFLSKRSLK